MQLRNVTPLKNWTGRLAGHGCRHYHFRPDYWLEQVGIEISMTEFERMEDQLKEVHSFGRGRVEEYMYRMYESQWIEPEDYQWMKLSLPSGCMLERLDFTWNHGSIKVFDWNTQVLTGLFDAAITQWLWSSNYVPELEQFNLIQASLLQSIVQRKVHISTSDHGGILDVPRPTEPVFFWGLQDADNPLNDADLQMLRNLWVYADVPVKTLQEGSVRFREFKPYDPDGISIGYIQSQGPMEGFLGTIWRRAPVRWMQGPWAMAMEHKGFLAHLHDANQKLAVAPTTFHAKEGWIPKDAWSHLSGGVGKDSKQPIIWQEPQLSSPLDDWHVVWQAWFVDGNFVGLSPVVDTQLMHDPMQYHALAHIIA